MLIRPSRILIELASIFVEEGFDFLSNALQQSWSKINGGQRTLITVLNLAYMGPNRNPPYFQARALHCFFLDVLEQLDNRLVGVTKTPNSQSLLHFSWGPVVVPTVIVTVDVGV
jgi:hypothetical protein